MPLTAVAKGMVHGQGGMVKVVAEAGGGQVLGVHLVGPHVSEMIAESQLIVGWDAEPADVARHVHAHPTLSEAVGEVFPDPRGTRPAPAVNPRHAVARTGAGHCVRSAPGSLPRRMLDSSPVPCGTGRAKPGGQVGGESSAGAALSQRSRTGRLRSGVGGSGTRAVRAASGGRLARGRPLHLLSVGHARRAVPRGGGCARQRTDGRFHAAGACRKSAGGARVAGGHLLALPAVRGPGRGESAL